MKTRETVQKLIKFFSENKFDDKKYTEFLRSLPVDVNEMQLLARKNGATEYLRWLSRAYILQQNHNLTISDIIEFECIARAIYET